MRQKIYESCINDLEIRMLKANLQAAEDIVFTFQWFDPN